jgi:hypothetical protein
MFIYIKQKEKKEEERKQRKEMKEYGLTSMGRYTKRLKAIMRKVEIRTYRKG